MEIETVQLKNKTSILVNIDMLTVDQLETIRDNSSNRIKSLAIKELERRTKLKDND